MFFSTTLSPWKISNFQHNEQQKTKVLFFKINHNEVLQVAGCYDCCVGQKVARRCSLRTVE